LEIVFSKFEVLLIQLIVLPRHLHLENNIDTFYVPFNLFSLIGLKGVVHF